MPHPSCTKPLFFILKRHSMTMTNILWTVHSLLHLCYQPTSCFSLHQLWNKISHCLFTLKMGSKTRATKVRGYLVPSSEVGTFMNFPSFALKYLEKNIWFWPVPVLICYLVIFCRPMWLILVVEIYLSPHSFFIMSSTFLACSAGVIWVLPLAANLAAYISANCFKVKAQPWSPEPKPTVPMTGSI